MSCCLVLLSSDTLDMLSRTSTFRICHSSKRKKYKWLLIYSSLHLDQKDPISHQHYVHRTRMILHHSFREHTLKKFQANTAVLTVIQVEVPGQNQHPLCQCTVTQHFYRKPFFQFLLFLWSSTYLPQIMQSHTSAAYITAKPN